LRRSIWLAALSLVFAGSACAAPAEKVLLDPLVLRGALGARARPVAQSDAGVVVVFNSNGMGSGFVVSTDGAVLTNAHVVGRSRKLKVRWSDGSESQATLLRINR
jgi:S1-C subfamily serine protease